MKAFAAVKLPAAVRGAAELAQPTTHSCRDACSSQPSCYHTTAENVFQEKRLLLADFHPSRAASLEGQLLDSMLRSDSLGRLY